jgi:hypothetical protein
LRGVVVMLSSTLTDTDAMSKPDHDGPFLQLRGEPKVQLPQPAVARPQPARSGPPDLSQLPPPTPPGRARRIPLRPAHFAVIALVIGTMIFSDRGGTIHSVSPVPVAVPTRAPDSLGANIDTARPGSQGRVDVLVLEVTDAGDGVTVRTDDGRARPWKLSDPEVRRLAAAHVGRRVLAYWRSDGDIVELVGIVTADGRALPDDA